MSHFPSSCLLCVVVCTWRGYSQSVWVGFINIGVCGLTFYYSLEDLDPHFGFIWHS